MITLTIWHNVAHDAEGRHTAMLDGYQPGDPVVAVFTYQADPAGRTAEQIADEAFDIFTGHPRDAAGADLACAYYGRRLRSLPFPGDRRCCSRSRCSCRCVVWLSSGRWCRAAGIASDRAQRPAVMCCLPQGPGTPPSRADRRDTALRALAGDAPARI
jgi:hypothetical protein